MKTEPKDPGHCNVTSRRVRFGLWVMNKLCKYIPHLSCAIRNLVVHAELERLEKMVAVPISGSDLDDLLERIGMTRGRPEPTTGKAPTN